MRCQAMGEARSPPVVRIEEVGLSYGKTRALDGISLDVPPGCMNGLIGPDGVGKSSLLSLIVGAHVVQDGRVEVLGGDIADATHRLRTCPRIAYMPQGLGKNLYPTLSVFENIDFFGRLFGQGKAERERRIAQLLEATGLAPFPDRPAGKLSGGMKQKLGLCCSLIHDPDLLILDEPTTGVDPLSRRQFWELIDNIRSTRPGMSVMVATAYMEEAARFDWLVAMDAGRVLATGPPAALLAETGTTNLDDAFIALLPEEKRQGHRAVVIPPRPAEEAGGPAIEAEHLTMRFGDFTAVDDVSFKIARGEIFGFLGSNGCGKSTTMKMLTGLLTPTEGTALLFGREVDPNDMDVRRHVGYMSQAFSLYSELTVHQNLDLHARLYGLPPASIAGRVQEMAERFDLVHVMDALPDALPLGVRQRLSLAVAMIHSPDILILDEPTSGVDPVARDNFWEALSDLSRKDNVTIFVSTHFMNEAARCDRISLMNAGHVLVTGTPAEIVKSRSAESLEQAFIAYLEDATGIKRSDRREVPHPTSDSAPVKPLSTPMAGFLNLRRMLAYTQREALELMRDPIRLALATVGSVLLMFVIGYGINLDVDNLSFAVLDFDDSRVSRDYALQIAGSRYFVEKAPITDYDDLDRRMRGGKLTLAIEIPPGFGRDLARGRNVQIAAWVDGAMPSRGEVVRGYVEENHVEWLGNKQRESASMRAATRGAVIRGQMDPSEQARLSYGQRAATDKEPADAFGLQVRFRYNPGFESLVAMVPAVIALLLLIIPAMLSVLSVVREKELGSIINFYVTPVTRLEFLMGKQIPYVLLAMQNFLALTAFGVFVFRVPLTGSFLTLTAAALLYVVTTTATGLVISAFTRSQIAAIFTTAIVTLIPAINYSGLVDPVSSLQGIGALIGNIFPTTFFMTITRGVFSKGLDFAALQHEFVPLFIAVLVLMGLGVALLNKQER